jgi:methylmalonyl-CoA mutase N-terminal domain/subunit
VNGFVTRDEQPIEILQIAQSARDSQCAKLKKVRADRDCARVERALDNLKRAARGEENTMPPIIEAVRSYATLGEICDALRDVFGTYREQSIL